MTLDDKIQSRAYELFLADVGRMTPKALDDWLAVEAEVLASELAKAVAAPGYDQDRAWYDGDAIETMFAVLSRRFQNRRAGNVLMTRIASYQDYLTAASEVTDAEALLQGTNALHIYILGQALRTLLGDDLSGVDRHSLRKELKDLFSVERIAHETSTHNVTSAAALIRASGVAVTFIAEERGLSPDIRVEGIAYVECKDLHPASRAGLAKGLADQLSKATAQLNAAQQRQALPGTGVCIDVPWGNLPLCPDEWDAVRTAISANDAPDFIYITCSGVSHTDGAVGYPMARCLVTKALLPQELTLMVERLASRSYALAPQGFDEIVHPTH